MTAILVCPLSKLHETVRESGASHLVSLLADGPPVDRPPGLAATNHLDLRFHDITEATDGLVLARPVHVETLIAFVGNWDRRRPLVIHCYAGISRSTAAAYITLCANNPSVGEASHANSLRAASPTATPNRHLVGLADELLGRDGRMVAATDSIGRGETAAEGVPFTLAPGP